MGQLVKALPAPVQKLVRRVRATPKAKIRVPAGSTFIFAARPYGNGFTLEGVRFGGGRWVDVWGVQFIVRLFRLSICQTFAQSASGVWTPYSQ